MGVQIHDHSQNISNITVSDLTNNGSPCIRIRLREHSTDEQIPNTPEDERPTLEMASELRKEIDSPADSNTMKPRRLKGHKSDVTYCIASRLQPGLVVSSDEGGCVCLFDLRCKDVVFTLQIGANPVSCLCFGKAGKEDTVYASSGTEIKSFDFRVPSSLKYLDIYNYNKEEINQIAFCQRSSFLAAADDSGDVKIIDTQQQCLFRTLRTVHTSICSSVQFLFWKPWSVITGGLDLKLALWDFSRGHSINVIDYGLPDSRSKIPCKNPGQSFNPAFIHSIAVREDDKSSLNKICAVARGDGVVDVMDIESELGSVKSKSTLKQGKGRLAKSKGLNSPNGDVSKANQKKRLQLDYSLGGHSAAVSCVSFSTFGEIGRFIISGADDALVKMWDWTKYFDADQDSSSNALRLNISTRNKINWLCSTSSDSENLIVCDTSKVIKVYTVS